MNYWIQRADFGATDFESTSTEAVVEAFETHDWSGELSFETELEAADKERCPPGFGIVATDDRILHLCPQTDDTLHCHYHYSERRRILGLFPTERGATETWLDELSSAADLIRLFGDHRHEDLVARAKEKPI